MSLLIQTVLRLLRRKPDPFGTSAKRPADKTAPDQPASDRPVEPAPDTDQERKRRDEP